MALLAFRAAAAASESSGFAVAGFGFETWDSDNPVTALSHRDVALGW